jgi:hypothetical protein
MEYVTMDWIIENKEWLFSGVAIGIPIALIGWFISSQGNKQVQKGGKNSTNIQVGGSLNIGGKKDVE